MREERQRVLGLDHLGRAGERLIDVAALRPDRRRAVDPGAEQRHDRRIVDAGARTLGPGDVEGIGRRLRLPEVLGHDRDRVLERHHGEHAAPAPTSARLAMLWTLPPNTGDCRIVA